MSNCRFVYHNLITEADMLAVSSAQEGTTGMGAKAGAGSAAAYFQGSYTGDDDDKYLVEIDSVTAGNEVGQATYRWKRESSGTWQASGVTTSANWQDLDNGLQVRFVSGTGDDFLLGDGFSCLAIRDFGRARLLDGDRDTVWRSAGVGSEHVFVDLGTADRVTALCLPDHNLSQSATLTLKADAIGADWNTPDWSSTVTRRQGIITHFLDQTFRYWRLELADSSNTDGYLEASGLFLGTYFEPARQFGGKYVRETVAGRKGLKSDAQVLRTFTEGQVERWRISFARLPASDVDGLLEWWQHVHDRHNRRVRPFFFVPWPDDPDETIYCLPTDVISRRHVIHDRFDVKFVIEEVARSA